MGISGTIGRKNLSSLNIQFNPLGEIFAETTGIFKIKIENGKKFLPSFLIKAVINGNETIFPVIDRKGEEGKIAEVVFPKRGKTTKLSALLKSPFPFGFFYLEKAIEINSNLIVYPKPIKTELTPLTSPEKESRKNGTETTGSEEFKKIRNYKPGDEQKKIHWKIFAKKDKFYTKEFIRKEGEEPIIIELNKFSGTIEQKLSKATYAITKLWKNRAVGFKSGEILIKPDKTKKTKRKILELLATYPEEKDENSTDI